MKRSTFLGIVPALLCLELAAGCASQQEVIRVNAPATPLTPAEIESDPWAVLPGGGYGWIYLDARALFASEFGPGLTALFERRGWLPPAAGFTPARDLEAVHLGLYTMQGIDVAGVGVGNFDPGKIASAMEQGGASASRVERTEYAGRVLYRAAGAGFSVLTPRVLVFGSEAGVRRALDRIRLARLRQHVPDWLLALLANRNAPIAGGIDLGSHPVPDALRRELAFVDGMHTARLLGNFQPPGFNLAGTSTYDSPDAAQRGANNLLQLQRTLSSYGWLMALVGIKQPLRRLDARASEENVEFVAELDAAALRQLIDQADRLIPQGGGGG